MHFDLIICLTENDLAFIENRTESERPWNLNRIQEHESFEGPDPSRPIQRCRHEQMWKVMHLVQMRDVLIMTTVGVD